MWKKLFSSFFEKKPTVANEDRPGHCAPAPEIVAPRSNEDRPVHRAARENAQELAIMLDSSPKLRDEPGWFGRLPIHVAAEAGKSDCLDLLLARGASAHAREGLHGQTPLHHAVSSDNYACIDHLIRAGADVNAADKRGETPIFYAKSLAAIERLAAAGANLGVISERGQYPFQYCAAYVRRFDVLQFWVKQNISINHAPSFGWPALNAVCARLVTPQESPDDDADRNLIDLLLANGANIDLQDNDGNTALHSCCLNRRIPLVEHLLKRNANVHIRNRAGETPLHVAVFRNSEELVRLLLGRGADVNVANQHHLTPFETCKEGLTIQGLMAPLHKQVAHPVSTSEAVVNRLLAIPKFHSVAIQGCTDAEITQLEEHFKLRLPASYRDFLRIMGRGAGSFMESDHWRFRLNDVFSIGRDPEYAEYCDLPDNYFVFAERNGCAWVFFVADGKSDDPPVFLFTDGEDRSYEQTFRSVWDFVESLVIDYEIWYGADESIG